MYLTGNYIPRHPCRRDVIEPVCGRLCVYENIGSCLMSSIAKHFETSVLPRDWLKIKIPIKSNDSVGYGAVVDRSDWDGIRWGWRLS